MKFDILSQKLVDLLDLSHCRHDDISEECPPRFGRLGDLAKLCVGKRHCQPFLVVDSFSFRREPLQEKKHRINVGDALEVCDNKVKAVCKTPDVFWGDGVWSTILNNHSFQMGRHTIHISNHILCPVCSDAREFLKGGVEIFELVKNEFRKLFPVDA